MRVITGSAKGRRLMTPEGAQVRPTSDVAKEAIFSIIQFEVEGAQVLDLFAGSGQLGIEALSRGAAGAVFVDRSREAQSAIRHNLDKTGLAQRARLVAGDALSFLKVGAGPFDIAFVDPPYHLGLLGEVLPLVAGCMRPGGVILCESMRDERLPEAAGELSFRREYRYGRTKITTYRRPKEESL
jgi:16S rRNA (guanine966-N2)-methyltransferase